MLRRGTHPNGTIAWGQRRYSAPRWWAPRPRCRRTLGSRTWRRCCPRRSLGSWAGGRKTVGAPVLAADAVVHREETIGVVALLDLSEALVVRTPKCLLPIGLKVVAFVDVGAC